MRGDEITRASIKRRAFIPGLTKRRLERARAHFFRKKLIAAKRPPFDESGSGLLFMVGLVSTFVEYFF